MSQTLYLKYRPRDFDTVVGQEIVRITLKNAAKASKLSHAYLLTGPRGVGKTSIARIIAKAINCSNLREDGNPCNQCSICTAINDGRMIDIIEIDAASHTSVDDVRDLIDKARFMPNEAKKKVYIIDEVHMLSKSAFNALLKTLEEPPERVHFILATTEVHKIPETIISRCQKFDFKRIENKDIVYYLKYIGDQEGIETEVKALNLIAKVSEGGMRNAIGTFEKVIRDKRVFYETVVDALDITGVHVIESLYEDVAHKRLPQAIEKVTDLYEGGASMSQFMKDSIEFLREKFLETIKSGNNEESFVLLQHIELLEKANLDLKTTIIPQLPLEMAITKMCYGDTITVTKTTSVEEKKERREEIKRETPEEKPLKKEEKKKEEVTTPEVSTIDLSFESIRNAWVPLCLKIPTAKNKQAFKSAIPTKLDGTTLTIAVSSKIVLEMIKNTTAQMEIEKILIDTFGQKISLVPTLEKVESLTSSPKEETKKNETGLSPEEAAALMGGMIIE